MLNTPFERWLKPSTERSPGNKPSSTALAIGEWVRVFRGAYRIAGTEPTWDQTAMACYLAAGPGAVVSHRAAASLQGMPGVPRRMDVTVVRPRQVTVVGLIAHRSRLLPPEDVG